MTKDISKSIEACAAHYGDDADAVKNYLIEGQTKALELPNRGPLKFDAYGNIHNDILEAYSKFGFYVLKGVISDKELNDIKADLDKIRDNFPTHMGAEKDKHGRPALGSDNKAMTLQWARPLSDPLGGTEISNGRHQVKLFEPKAADDAPPAVPVYLSGSLQFSPACLRVYAHPGLLKLAETLNGPDFVPFTEGLFIKDAGLGAAVSWHQDGDTHWGSPNFDENIHGFNFMGQIYGSTAVNGVWVVPGSHKHDRADIVKMVEESGSERLVNAVPIICSPGDVVINNRQVVHGSFANTGFETRVTVNFGFHKRSSVLNIKGAGIHAEAKIMDSEYINKRSEVIALAINARKKRFPEEKPFNYTPLSDNLDAFDWNESSQAGLKDYNLMDLSI
ncbi:MAG: phytanoyl-CoA dioxygenase family protein [Hellea sp.]|nr:phytanoyl-CoA dioxygenase family protein [Hellea sp.]MDG1522960.1 phytanoyl-CoA dioxygenase family protein [Hellea sp.]MDG1667075.1 phytanoyl-CoA dioxygenase family protein [Hellea sp.]MDG2361386.1 phytanoyl-CoA dioxygenase family protein [Hellea sp.]